VLIESAAFKEDKDPEKEAATNVHMMHRVVLAIKSLSHTFTSFTYPGGTRVCPPCYYPPHLTKPPQGYGIYLPTGLFTPPLKEEMALTLPADYAKTVAYPHYRAMLTKESTNEPWTWTELVPDAIIGFTPNGSGFSLAGHWAVYLCAWRLVYGDGATVPFPGTRKGWTSAYTETSASMLARIAVHASLHHEAFGARLVNVADSAKPSRMSAMWPLIAGWFGLKGVEPAETEGMRPSAFIAAHEGVLKDAGVKGVRIWNAEQLDSYGYWLTFDRHLSLERLRGAGWSEEKRPEEGWWEAFEMFRRAGMIV
jgi:hypothetical protein